MFNYKGKVYTLSSNGNSIRYKVKVHTSKYPSSSFSSINLCIFGEEKSFLKSIQPYPLLETLNACVYTFDGPNIGNVSSILVAPQEGTLQVDLIELSVNDGEAIVFPCFETVGKRGSRGAISSDSQEMKLSKQRKLANDLDYLTLKNTINFESLQLSILGTSIMAAAFGLNVAASFSIGGITSMVYMLMLQNDIENITKDKIRAQSIPRIVFIALATSSFMKHVDGNNLYFLSGLSGFFMYKIAILLHALRSRKTK